MLDFTKEALEKDLPPPGAHDATITRVNVAEHPDVSYLAMDLELGDGTVVSDIRTIQATANSGRVEDARRGIAAVRQLAEAIGVDATKLKTPADVENALIGAKLRAQIQHRTRSGIKTAMVKAFEKLDKAPPSLAKT
jgi:hypothetical protein